MCFNLVFESSLRSYVLVERTSAVQNELELKSNNWYMASNQNEESEHSLGVTA